ncbi:MAG: signal peptidase I [Acidobacteria bacterium]|nr:signal peptidase I [Acidobacteriota bacterium]
MPLTANQQTEEKISEATPSRKSAAREYLESLVVTVILALYGTTFLVQAFKIPSSSMEDTLLIGDHLMVDKVSYAPPSRWEFLLPYTSVERDQIIVFRYPLDPGTYFVKRVVGVPGDRIHLRSKLVYRNGIVLQEPHAVHKSSRVEEFRDNFPSPALAGYPEWADRLEGHLEDGELVVPPGQYFVMGDNRDFSSDSRYWGFVPRENIVGNPLLIYWSYETSNEDYRNTSAVDYLVQLLDVAIHFPQKTRWRRMFQVVQ